MSILVALICFLSPVHLILAEEGDQVITLKKAIDMTLKNNLNLSVSKLKTEEKKSSLQSNLGAFDPNMTFSYTYDDDDTPSSSTLDGAGSARSVEYLYKTYSLTIDKSFSTGTTLSIPYTYKETHSNSSTSTLKNYHETTLEFQLDQPLIKPFIKNYYMEDIIISEYDSLIEILNQDESKQKEIIKTVKLFFEVYETSNTTKIKKTSWENSINNFNFTKRKNKLGQVSKIDLLDAESKMRTKESQYLEAKTKFQNKKMEFANQIMESPSNNFTILVNFEEIQKTISKNDEDVKYDNSFYRRADFQKNIKEIKKKKLNLKTAEVDRFPDVDLNLESSLKGLNSSFSKSNKETRKADFTSWQAGLTITQPIMRYAKKASYEMARIKLKQEELKREQLKRDIIYDIFQNKNKLKNEKKKLEALSLAKSAEVKKFNASQAKFKNGIISQHELNEALEDKEEAEIDLIKGQISLVETHFDFLKAKGNLLKEI